MKSGKISVLFSVCFFFFFNSCKKEEESSVIPQAIMEPVIFNFTSTGDSTCGFISRPVMDSVRLLYPNAIIVNSHLNTASATDPLSNTFSEGLAQFYNVYTNQDSTNAIPYSYFACDGFLGGFNYSGISYASLSTSIDWAKEVKAPAMALNIKPTLSGNQLTIEINYNAVHQFYTEAYLSVYLTEDSVNTTQVNDYGLITNLHHDVLRSCPTAFNGDKIADNLLPGAQGDYTCFATLNPDWNINKMKINVVVWYKDNIYGNMVHLGKRVSLL